MERSEKMRIVRDYISLERQKRGIEKLETVSRPELSGEMFGEFSLLLDVQLMQTAEGYGDWQSLNDDDILNGVVTEIQRRMV
jgi:hypothetical protein